MSWIKTISFEEAAGSLRRLYEKITGPDNNVDNVLKIHSLRPHTLTGHMALYKNVLHNSNNTIPKWFLESLGVYVSHLNKCNYCVEHHFSGLSRLLNEETRSQEILKAVHSDDFTEVFDDAQQAAMAYAKKLTLTIGDITQNDVEQLKTVGYDDGQILEINQVVSYFCYVNRTVVGLGVNTEGDVLGLSPNNSDDPDSWSHQ